MTEQIILAASASYLVIGLAFSELVRRSAVAAKLQGHNNGQWDSLDIWVVLLSGLAWPACAPVWFYIYRDDLGKIITGRYGNDR